MRRKLSGKSAVSGRKKSSGKRRSRRRLSGMGSLDIGQSLMSAGMLGLGAAAGRLMNTVIVKQSPTFSPMLSGALQAAVGIALPMFVKGSRFITMLGYGMMANGVMVIIQSTGVISGVGAADTMTFRVNGRYPVNGLNSNHTVAGLNSGNTVAGLNSGHTVAGRSRKRYTGMVGCV